MENFKIFIMTVRNGGIKEGYLFLKVLTKKLTVKDIELSKTIHNTNSTMIKVIANSTDNDIKFLCSEALTASKFDYSYEKEE
jgi:hypothetical protein